MICACPVFVGLHSAQDPFVNGRGVFDEGPPERGCCFSHAQPVRFSNLQWVMLTPITRVYGNYIVIISYIYSYYFDYKPTCKIL